MQTRKFELCFVQPTQTWPNAMAAVVATGIDGSPLTIVETRIRAFDRKSYQYCLLAVKRNFFGLINRKWFLFVDVQTGVRYAFESTEVANEFGFPAAVLTIGIHKVQTTKTAGVEVEPAKFEDWSSLRATFGVGVQSKNQSEQAPGS